MIPLVIVGDTLLDRDVDGAVHRVAPDAPVPVLDETSTSDRPGGAGLAALLAARAGRPVALVTALADDAAGARLAELLTAEGVQIHALSLAGATPEKIRLRAAGQVLLRLDRGGDPVPPGEPPPAVRELLASARSILVSDYGRGVARQPGIRAALSAATAPVVWDPHPRGPAPVPGVKLATPNEAELRQLSGCGAGSGMAQLSRGAQALRDRWRAGAVAVTRGGAGALLCHAGPNPLAVPAPAVGAGDTCGAGDRFAVAAATALGAGALVSEAVERAVAEAAAFVAAGAVGGLTAQPPGRAAPAPLGHPNGHADGHADGSAPAGAGPDGSASPTANGGASAGSAPAGSAANGSSANGGAAFGSAAADSSGGEPGDRAAAGRLVARVRARRGTVVATGGCFDLLHAGHLATLRAARGLGDCLVVCLNSDASVAGLKGPGRPVVPERDRARLLAALDCVDAVVVFGEPTPHAVLSWLRPDVWVKGGDYGGDLPEADLVRRWGGQAVTVPYLDGRSTTRLIAAARVGGAADNALRGVA